MDSNIWHVSVISPVLFLIPSILVTGIGQAKVVVWNPLFLVNLVLMSTPVVPLSTSAWVFTVIPFCWTRTSRWIDGDPLYLFVNEIHLVFEFESESIVCVIEGSCPLTSTAGVRGFKNPVQHYRGVWRPTVTKRTLFSFLYFLFFTFTLTRTVRYTL